MDIYDRDIAKLLKISGELAISKYRKMLAESSPLVSWAKAKRTIGAKKMNYWQSLGIIQPQKINNKYYVQMLDLEIAIGMNEFTNELSVKKLKTQFSKLTKFH